MEKLRFFGVGGGGAQDLGSQALEPRGTLRKGNQIAISFKPPRVEKLSFRDAYLRTEIVFGLVN